MTTTRATPSIPHTLSPPDARRSFRRVAGLLVGVNTILILTTAFSAEKLSFLYKDRLGLDAGSVATLGILLLLPSYLRPVLGSVADVFPLWGWHRRSYFALGVGLNAAGYAALSALPHFALAPVAACVLLALTGVYLRLVIVEAVLVRAGNALGRLSQLQTILWLVPSVMTILWGAHLSGFVTQHWSYPACFRAAALSALLALPLAALIDERRLTPGVGSERRGEVRADRAQTRQALRDGLRDRGLWAVIAFVFCLQLAPRTGTAGFFFMVDGLHFTKQFLGNLGAWTSAGEVTGILAFGLLAPRVPVRILVRGVIALAAAFYVPLFWLRGPVSAEITGLLTSGTNIMVLCGVTTLAARACPPRIEAMAFGLVMAAMTLGGALSERLGSALYLHFGAGGALRAGWHGLLWVGMGAALVSAAFVPLLPDWTRSRGPLRGRG